MDTFDSSSACWQSSLIFGSLFCFLVSSCHERVKWNWPLLLPLWLKPNYSTTRKYEVDSTISCRLWTSSSSSVVSASFVLAIDQVTAHAGISEGGIPLSAEVTLWPARSFPKMRATSLTGSEGFTPTVIEWTTRSHCKYIDNMQQYTYVAKLHPLQHHDHFSIGTLPGERQYIF